MELKAKHSPLAVLCIGLAMLATYSSYSSAAEEAIAIEEVVVTARKRSESLLEIPESVVAISGELVDRQNIKGLNKIGRAVPNVNLSMRTDSYPNVSIRGVGAFGLTQGVGFHVDGVQIYKGDASSRFGDIERIEVLKGPQGTMYGGSNIGGAIKYVTKRPSSEEFEGRLKLLGGEQGIVDGEINLNVPIDDNWAMRVFAYTRTDDGFMTNPNSPSPVFGLLSNNPKNITKYEENAVRLSLSGDLTDNFSLYATARYSDYDGPANNWSRELIDGAANANTGIVPSGMAYSKILDANNMPIHERDTVGASLELTWVFDNFDLMSITSYSDTNSERLTDVDGTQLWIIYTDRPETYEVFTQELRITSTLDSDLQWMMGLYMEDIDTTMRSTLDLGWLLLGAEEFLHVLVPFETRDEEDSKIAAFGNITYTMGDWELGLGLRVDRWEAKESAVDIGHSASRSETEVLGNMSITRNLGDSGIAYFSVGQGYEPGAWNGIADGVPPVFGPNGEKTLLAIAPEELIQYELGWKSRVLDGRGSVTAAFFYSEYENRRYEYKAKNPDGSGTLIDGVTNVGDSTQYGLELAANFQVTNQLTISASLGLIDAEWDDGVEVEVGGALIDLSGRDTSNVVTESWNLGFNYFRPLNNGFEFIADMQLSHRGEQDGGAPWDVLTNDSFQVVDLQIGIQSDRWELMLNIDNVTDEEYYTDLEPFDNFSFSGLTGGGEPARIAIGTLGHPRLVTASVSYSF
jgi:iron complex outermembrane receptor protein|tara:strand:- start:108 stop:2342 length:2235 start_codon:yes stop_codon:yes gene_type:complete